MTLRFSDGSDIRFVNEDGIWWREFRVSEDHVRASKLGKVLPIHRHTFREAPYSIRDMRAVYVCECGHVKTVKYYENGQHLVSHKFAEGRLGIRSIYVK